MALKCFEGTNVPIVEVVKLAKQYYVESIGKGLEYSICQAIHKAIVNKLTCSREEAFGKPFEINLFNRDIAKEKFGAGNGWFWWPIENYQIRLDYFDLMIDDCSKEV